MRMFKNPSDKQKECVGCKSFSCGYDDGYDEYEEYIINCERDREIEADQYFLKHKNITEQQNPLVIDKFAEIDYLEQECMSVKRSNNSKIKKVKRICNCSNSHRVQLSKAKKFHIAQIQNFKCANDPKNKSIEYDCLLWKYEKGKFDNAGYEIDHVIEVAEGGGNDENNLQALCSSCHKVKTRDYMKKRIKK